MFEKMKLNTLRKILERFRLNQQHPHIRTTGDSWSSSFFKYVWILDVGKDYVEFEHRSNSQKGIFYQTTTFPLREIAQVEFFNGFGREAVYKSSKQKKVDSFIKEAHTHKRKSLKKRFKEVQHSAKEIALRTRARSFFSNITIWSVGKDHIVIKHRPKKGGDFKLMIILFSQIRHVEFEKPRKVKESS
ncbi:hypothetical protein MYX06_00755 [Patescibacteria group bacterium AH-259-L05]|nr:hypothetical protein [Patescibacteria group bacterium AH-259-L05]